ncbi:MAG: hypothetical protein HWN68_19780, partial [Desulfobacterales bacterium]|nr:hypothetical protein [Desulfobacterales bacterium]
TFAAPVTADGTAAQTFDATTGTLLAKNTVNNAVGDLTLAGTAITLNENVSAVGLTLDGPVTATKAAAQKFDAGAGTLLAKNTMTKTGAGNLTLGGATGINLGGTVDVQSGNLTLEDNTTVASDKTLKASGNVILADGKTLTGASSLTIEATNGEIQAAGAGSTISVSGSSLTLKQALDLDLANFTFANQTNTDLTAQSYNGSFTADNTKVANAADQWNSITATAKDNIELSGVGNINIASAGISSTFGGVKIVSSGGTISTPGAGGKLDAPITGYSDYSTGIGVDWLTGSGKAAIIIQSYYEELKLGANATLTANGSYDPDNISADDRLSFLFNTGGEQPGEPIDVAIYLGSFYNVEDYPYAFSPYGGVEMGSGYVSIDNTDGIGTLLIDAYDTITFTPAFENSLTNLRTDNVEWLEVVSRYSPDIDTAKGPPMRLPHADNLSDIAGGLYDGTYVLRGLRWGATEVLGVREAVPLVLPKPLEPQDQGQVEFERRDAEVLGLGDKPELARAYPPSLNTDLNLDKAAQILFVLMPILRDSSRIATLDRIVVEIWQDVDQPIAPEQEAMIAQRISGTPAEEWVAALTEYVDVMSTMVGRLKTESVLWVMQTFVIPQAEEGLLQDQTVAFLEAQID